MEYCIVASNYRTEKRQVHVFLDNVVTRLVDRGEKCNVIAPQSIIRYLFKKNDRRPLVSKRLTDKGNEYIVYSPIYMVFPTTIIGGLHLSDLTKWSYTRAVTRTYRKYGFKADVVYSHFVQAGISAVRLAKKIGKPSFIANGEADTIDSLKYVSKNIVDETLRNVSGIISVSTKNKDEIKEMCKNVPVIMNKVSIIPNAVDQSRFHLLDKKECRKQLGWPEDAFIVSFTGSFIERKGARRLSNALDRIDGAYGVFVGRGEVGPTCKNILLEGRVENAKIPTILNASDVFCLPTLAEGCSNAIVEAVACGVPVVSSNLPFNFDILDDSCSILVDPMDEEQIYQAIKKIKDNPSYLQQLHEGCIEKSKTLSLEYRVDRIQEFVSKMS